MFPEQFVLHVDRPLFSSDSTCLFNVWPKISSISPKDYKVKTLDVCTIYKVINVKLQAAAGATHKNPQGGGVGIGYHLSNHRAKMTTDVLHMHMNHIDCMYE